MQVAPCSIAAIQHPALVVRAANSTVLATWRGIGKRAWLVTNRSIGINSPRRTPCSAAFHVAVGHLAPHQKVKTLANAEIPCAAEPKADQARGWRLRQPPRTPPRSSRVTANASGGSFAQHRPATRCLPAQGLIGSDDCQTCCQSHRPVHLACCNEVILPTLR